MNEPIISPLFIYLLSITENIIFFLEIIGGLLICSIFYLLLNADLLIEENKIIFKKIVIILCVCFLMLIFIPSKNTLLSMLVSKYITIDNIIKGKELIQNSVDYIINAIK